MNLSSFTISLASARLKAARTGESPES